MIDKNIEYKSIIMRCDQVNAAAYLGIPETVEIKYYVPGMESIWVDIQKSVGEFEGYTDEGVLQYFQNKYMTMPNELLHRCIFLKERKTGLYIGTCCAWFEKKGANTVPVLHWLAVRNGHENRGYARMLVTEVMKIFNKVNEGEPIYLHTQPCSYKAIKVYNDFGFCIAKCDKYGSAENECYEAMDILQRYMKPDAYEKIVKTLVI